MKRFLFEYTILSTGAKRTFSIAEESEELARQVIQERIADIEFTELEDIQVEGLVKTLDLKDTYYECEGCT